MSDAYAELKDHFAAVEGVVVNSGRGSQGIKVGGKMVVMFYKGQLLVRLPPARATEIIDSGEGSAFDPGTGNVMPDRVLVPASRKDSWVGIAEESVRLALSR
jgi:hypothetical protein